MLTTADLAFVGADADAVVKRVEAAIEASHNSISEVAAALTPAIYVIRARYEELYKRGATKSADWNWIVWMATLTVLHLCAYPPARPSAKGWYR